MNDILPTGKVYHSIDFNDATRNEVTGKRVVIVGIGNSAVDAACNCAEAGRLEKRQRKGGGGLVVTKVWARGGWSRNISIFYAKKSERGIK